MNATLKPLFTRQRRLRRGATFLAWAVVSIAGILLPLGLAAFLDDRLVLPAGWRWAALLLASLAALAAVGRAFRALRRPSDREVAAIFDAENRFVVGTAIGIDDAIFDSPEEAALVARLLREANKVAAAARPRHPYPRIWQILLALAGAALVAVSAGLPLKRVLAPWKPLPYTQVQVFGPERRPIAGEPFSIRGAITGRVPQTAQIEIAGAPPIPISVAADGTFVHAFDKGLPRPATLVVRAAKDGVSAPLRVDFREMPAPIGFDHRITPPDYTRQPPRAETNASFSMLRASDLDYSVTLDRPATNVRLVFDTNRDPLMLKHGSGNLWTGSLWKLLHSTGYRIEALDVDGTWRPCGDENQIVVTPDEPPKVRIDEHNADKIKYPDDTFRMKFRATDDVGLRMMAVRYQREGAADWQQVNITVPDDRPLEHAASWEIPMEEFAKLGVQAHDIVLVVVQAGDDNTLDGPGMGFSEPIAIEMPEGLAWKTPQSGGGGGGGGNTVNPLAIERQLRRETLRATMDLEAPSDEELTRRQRDNAKNIADMLAALQGRIPKEAEQLIKVAGLVATNTAETMDNGIRSSEGMENQILTSQALVIDFLIRASRLMEDQLGPPQPGEGRQFTLSEDDSAPPPNVDTGNLTLERAVAELTRALEQQQQINQQLQSDDGGQQSPQGENGQSPQPNGQQPGSGASGGSLASQQRSLSQQTAQVRAQLEALRQSANGGDPALAIAQLREAEQRQQQAAAAIANDSGDARSQGEQSYRELEQARDLTKSLLGSGGPAANAESMPHAPGYQSLIQTYSRRISYDE